MSIKRPLPLRDIFNAQFYYQERKRSVSQEKDIEVPQKEIVYTVKPRSVSKLSNPLDKLLKSYNGSVKQKQQFFGPLKSIQKAQEILDIYQKTIAKPAKLKPKNPVEYADKLQPYYVRIV